VRGVIAANTKEVDVSTSGLALSLPGIAVMLVSIFLPFWDAGSVHFVRLTGNSLIQAGDGLFFLVFAVVSAASLWRTYKTPSAGWGAVASGLLALGYAIWVGLDEQSMTLCSLEPATFGSECEVADPGLGVYAAGVGAILMIAGGLQLRSSDQRDEPLFGPRERPAEARPERPQLKSCPDCAEDVQAEARVCRFCTFRFPTCPDCAELVPLGADHCSRCGLDLRSVPAAAD
jgi:hypothetical protein